MEKRALVARTIVLIILALVVLLVCIWLVYYLSGSGVVGARTLNTTIQNLSNKVNHVIRG